MSEYASVSASSYDPSALAAKLTEKSDEGWEVVAIVPTGGDITAFLRRDGGASMSSTASTPESASTSTAAAYGVTSYGSTTASPDPAPAATEPAGWGAAPEPTAPPSPIAEPAPMYQPAAAPAYSPAPPVQSSPAVPAGWYADPAGRFDLRYWDGGTWTEHVSRNGQQYTDPPVA